LFQTKLPPPIIKVAAKLTSAKVRWKYYRHTGPNFLIEILQSNPERVKVTEKITPNPRSTRIATFNGEALISLSY